MELKVTPPNDKVTVYKCLFCNDKGEVEYNIYTHTKLTSYDPYIRKELRPCPVCGAKEYLNSFISKK